MGKTLVIAEKPSVAADLARVLSKRLGRFEKQGNGRDTYHENERAIIASAVGHLLELRMPTGPSGGKLPWKFEVLPAIPEKFELDPKPDTEARLKQVLRLASRKDVDHLVNACDAGREGELIFKNILEFGGVKKPVQRLWMQSMTPASIIEAWDHLRPDSEMENLADAAKCRSESDWLVGLNATRALTCFRSRHGGFNITAAGRVQTPTLAILAGREDEIRKFKPAAYSEVVADFEVAAGIYIGKWIDERWKRDESNPHSRPERIWEPELAATIRDRCIGREGRVEEEKKPSSQIAPQLYDLTTLQREAPFSAKGTLQLAQALYERHKMITYPRTDSRYLPEDYTDAVRTTMKEIAGSGLAVAKYAQAVIEGGGNGPRLSKSRRIFDSSKVSDHFAIIPTGTIGKLSEAEAKLFDMIVKRFIAVFYPNAEFEQTIRLTRIAHEGSLVDTFKTEGRVLVSPGWREVYGTKAGAAPGKDELVPIKTGEPARAAEVVVRNEETKPPARFTESTLLSAMEGAGKLVDDEALAQAMAERGLGTPATRAAIIEGLLAQKYIVRDGDGGRAPLHVTTNGMRLIELLHEMGAKALTSPSMTGDWEYRLRQMEHGKLSRSEFMRDIEGYTTDIVECARRHLNAAKEKDYPDVEATCPKCGATTLRQTDATYDCREAGCGFKLKKHVASRKLTPEEVRELLAKKFVGPLTGFISKFNKPFGAGLELDDKFKVKFVFDKDDQGQGEELNEDLVIGTARLPDGKEVRIYQTERAFVVPDLVTEKDPEGLRLGRKILQLEIPPAQIVKLLSAGKSDLLKGFISNRTRKPFSAHLTLDLASGKLGWEFAPRPPRNAAAPKPATSKA